MRAFKWFNQVTRCSCDSPVCISIVDSLFCESTLITKNALLCMFASLAAAMSTRLIVENPIDSVASAGSRFS